MFAANVPRNDAMPWRVLDTLLARTFAGKK